MSEPIFSRKDIGRFHTFFIPGDTDSCWEWLGSRDDSNYGLFRVNGFLEKAHRFAFIIEHGSIQLKCLHTCDNPPCVNPRHLFEGTSKDNAQDRDIKGRGVLPRPVILTPSDIAEADQLYKSGSFTYQQLANQYGVSLFCMYSNLTGRSYQ